MSSSTPAVKTTPSKATEVAAKTFPTKASPPPKSPSKGNATAAMKEVVVVQGGIAANDFVPSYGEHYNPPDDGTDDWDIPANVLENPLFVSTNKAGGIIQALRLLDKQMQETGLDHLISHKKTRNLWGSRVDAGQLGIYDHAGKPKIVIEPGNYWKYDYPIM
jgi:hypothetical protein